MKCPVCSSANLTSKRKITTFSEIPPVMVEFNKSNKRRFFEITIGDKNTVYVRECCICKDCGHVIYFIDNESLEKLKKIKEDKN